MNFIEQHNIIVLSKNEKYKGDVLQGKTYTTDPISHRRVVNMGEENQYYIAEHHEPIISERKFNQVQEILQKRRGVRGSGRRKGNFSRKYPFSSRLYCGFCGNLLTRRNWHSGTKNSITVWHCMEFVKHGKENCPYCKAMKENIIEESFTESYKLLCNNNKEVIQTFLNEMEEIIQEESNESSIKRLEEEKQILKEKIYQPEKNYEGCSYLENGGYFVRQSHIYQNPFYYIDYALAYVAALELWMQSLENKEEALEKYLVLARIGGRKSYLELLTEGGLHNPFNTDILAKITTKIAEETEKIEI